MSLNVCVFKVHAVIMAGCTRISLQVQHTYKPQFLVLNATLHKQLALQVKALAMQVQSL